MPRPQEAPTDASADGEEHVYRFVAGTELRLRVARPPQEGPHPAVIDVHGGAWRKGNRYSNAPLALALAERGLAVCSIDLRSSAQAPFPALVEDVHAGIRWISEHADQLGLLEGWLGGVGTSSGGHLLMLNALRPGGPLSAEPSARHPARGTLDRLALCYPVLDPLARYEYARAEKMGGLVEAHEAFFTTEDAMRVGSPQRLVENSDGLRLPPVWLVQGTADRNVTAAMAERFEQAYAARGGEIGVSWVPDMPHNFFNEYPDHPETSRAVDGIAEFLKGVRSP